jgi:outer membrane murein-binding lipoprotein Lpp
VRTVVRASVQVGAVVLSACALAGCSTDTGIDASVSPDGSSEAETARSTAARAQSTRARRRRAGTLDGG